MTETLWQQPLGDFLDATASDAPTPGGGSVTMVGAALGLGLVLMALRITARKKNDQALNDAINQGSRVLAELRGAAEHDVTLFEAFMAALKLPKASDEDKAARKQALGEAAVAATEGPLRAGGSALEGLGLACDGVTLTDPTVLSDVEAGGYLLAAAVRGVLLNVDANFGWLPDKSRVEEFRTAKEAALAQLRELEERFGVLLTQVRAR